MYLRKGKHLQETRESPYPIRMPSGLRRYLQQKANEMGRSLHSEIIRRLEQSCKQEESAQ